jgi:endonuclease III
MTREERFRRVLEHFERNEKSAETELAYHDAFSLLVAVMLSAQCTDKRVNTVTPALLARFPTAKDMANASPDEIFPFIKSISYPNSKARHLAGMARMLQDEFGSEVPSEVKDLMKLPGVGRKTANVIASVIYRQPTMAVDTHVFRVSARLGLTHGASNPLQCEKQLITFIPEHLVHKAHHWLILHGRYVCLARLPKCGECELTRLCRYYEKNFATAQTTKTKQQIKKITHGKKGNQKKSRQESR